ncbi:non-ribosomal peptide synthetase, partial [Dyella mobilis]
DAQPELLLSDAVGRRALGDTALACVPALHLDTSPLPWSTQSPSNPDAAVLGLHSRHLAYVIYTSGSTGKPKGVMIEHAAVCHQISALQASYGYEKHDRILQFASVSFDASIEEIFGALLTGASLVLRTQAWLTSVDDFIDNCALHQITVTSLPTSFWSQLVNTEGRKALPNTLRLMVIGGEEASAATLKAWCSQEGYRPELMNSYGPTETTVNATLQKIRPEGPWGSIGRPIANTRIYLLDANRQLAPLGAAGEIYIGGAGVARGYLNRQELTAERFLPDPFSLQADARMYRSGDLARYLPDGNLEFLGRNDHQVKIRGFRIEPGEIEVRLAEHPLVREAVVIPREDIPGDKRLVAYVTMTESGRGQNEFVSTLRAHLSTQLPNYMVPAAFVPLESLPLTPNGKLDRKALPAPDSDAYARSTYQAPQGETERALAALWEELLGVESVGRNDHFFELGGHSLLAVQLMARLRRQGLGVEIRALFSTPVLRDLAATLGSYREIAVPANAITSQSTAITPDMLPLIDLTQADIDRVVAQVPGGVANIQDIYALSPLQEGILFHHLLATEGDPYLLISQMAFADRDLIDRYLGAIQRVVDRHDILRTAFVWDGLSTPAQIVLRKVVLPVTTLKFDLQDGPIQEQLARRFDPRQHRLDLSRAPLLQFVVAQDTEHGRWLLLELQHHLIGDHSTLEILHAEVRAFLSGQDHALPVPQPFRNLIAHARLGLSAAEHEHFFRGMLGDIDEPTTPFGLVDVHRDGARVGQAHQMLPKSLNQRLRAQARRLGVNLASLCHLAWGQVVAKTSGRESVVFGTVLFGRMHGGEGADQAMGLFINTLPIRLDLDDTDVETSARKTHDRLAELLRHEHASLALAQRCSGLAGLGSPFSALLNYRHHVSAAALDTPVVEGPERLSGEERSNYPLTLSVEDLGDGLGLTVQVVQPVSPLRVCRFMQRALEQLADALEHTPHVPVRQLDVLPLEEKQLLLTKWNQTDAAYPQDQCIHELFEQQALRTPEATAVVFEHRSISYAQLNARANHLALQLVAEGVRPGQHVVTLIERGNALVVAQLAILKAGAIYVPVDTQAPASRANWIASDCGATHVLVDEMRALTAAVDLPVIVVYDNEIDAAAYASNPVLASGDEDVAYVMYTSGSTGHPKGVRVLHRGVARLVINNGYVVFDTQSRVAFASNPAFDASTMEVWGPLLNGGAIVIIDRDSTLDPARFAQALTHHAVTTLFLTTALFNQHVRTIAPALARLKYLLCGGERNDPESFWQLLEHGGPQHLIHCYGPTETTTFALTCAIDASYRSCTNLPIGRPIANTRIYVLDAHRQPVPRGVAGELYIGGAGV